MLGEFIDLSQSPLGLAQPLYLLENYAFQILRFPAVKKHSQFLFELPHLPLQINYPGDKKRRRKDKNGQKSVVNGKIDDRRKHFEN
jgi:hypothetical protein